MNSVDVEDVPDRSRYEAKVDGVLAAVAVYERDGDRVVFVHTATESGFEGHGVASVLAARALDDVRSRRLQVVPRCPFIRSYIDKNPEYADLVVPAPT